MVITSTPPPNPTSRPSSSSIPISEIVIVSGDPDSVGDVVDPPLHDRPWIEPYARGGTLKHQPSSSTTTADEAVERLTPLLQQRDSENYDLREEYTELRNEFTNSKFLVMRALLEASDIHSIGSHNPATTLAITRRPSAAHISLAHAKFSCI
ncbi:hypothetical protein LR48_Vigan02g085200 [Vigna angularis]|uniref:Uncharacterized protein n=1 Tax=Phaseolus angularis TaxID=3914 RepID=A0A0L9TWB2_PHAAN|nr:hypothetical protein LR48_Vigan02g085200 [Vigna angularis]